MHAYSWVITDIEAAGDILTAEELTAVLPVQGIHPGRSQTRAGGLVRDRRSVDGLAGSRPGEHYTPAT